MKPPEPKTSAEETTKQKGKSGKNRDKKSGKVKKTKDSKSVSKKCGSKGKAAKSNADKVIENSTIKSFHKYKAF